MKAVILAGGLGTRISEETTDKPKPMVPINGKPILWHIMNIFATQGVQEFIIATGYRGDVIKDYIDDLNSSWKINVVDTGSDTQTGGRIKICMDLIPGERIFATYGDGLANVNIKALLEFHTMKKKLATVTAVRPPARFGHLEIRNNDVVHFGEKKQSDAGWINGGFFVFESRVASFIDSLEEPLETGALPRLVEKSQLGAYHHHGFWQPMDTLREKLDLENFAKKSPPPWLELMGIN